MGRVTAGISSVFGLETPIGCAGGGAGIWEPTPETVSGSMLAGALLTLTSGGQHASARLAPSASRAPAFPLRPLRALVLLCSAFIDPRCYRPRYALPSKMEAAQPMLSLMDD